MGARRPGVTRGECGTTRRCHVLQGSGAVCAPLRERDLELDQNRTSTAGRVPYSRRLPDGAGTQTPQRFVWRLDIPLDEGRVRGVWPSVKDYINKRRATIAMYVVNRPILQECQEGERRRGSMPRQWWWEQELGLDV